MDSLINPRLKWCLPTLVAAATAVTAVLAGCGDQQAASRPVSEEAPLKVRIDRADNGAASPRGGRTSAQMRPRTFAFEMTGIGKMSRVESSAEDRAAAAQAAIIEALCNALMESRGADPRSASPFVAEFGPRLKVTRNVTPDGVRTSVRLVARGIETLFVAIDGRLQHEPHNLRLVQQIFEATNGEFSLLATAWPLAAGESVATVAHYHLSGSDAALAGDMGGRAGGVAGESSANP